MVKQQQIQLQAQKLSMKVFRQFGEYIHTEYGIKMPDNKHSLMQGRLQKRLKVLQLNSFSDYRDFVFSPDGNDEIVHMVDAISTNKTDFFREPDHFAYLTDTVLPALINKNKTGIKKRFLIWSAGCSTGEEPYTMAMVLSEFAENFPGFKFLILATDISTKVLHHAKNAVFSLEKTEPVLSSIKRKYFLRSKDKNKKLVRVIPQLRKKIIFKRLNFMDSSFGINEPLDVIFCRNVIIYFDTKTQEKLINKFADHLTPGGHLFLGHSETVTGLDVPFKSVTPTVYRKVDN